MADFIEVKNQRLFKRFPHNHQGRFFSNTQSKGWRDCQIVDISRKGVQIECSATEEISTGSIMCIEIYIPNQLELVSLKGTVKWVKKKDDKLISGIEFCKLLEEEVLNQIL